MARQSDEERLKKQRERQKKSRDAARATKRPNSNNVAHVALFWVISNMAQKADKDVLDEFHDRVVKLLKDQGFDEKASNEVLDDLIRKYRTGKWPFRRKVHLLFPNGPESED